MKTSSLLLGKIPFRLPVVLAAVGLIGSTPMLRAATFTYDAGASSSPGVLWSNGDNWVGNTVPTFNNQADLVFDTTIFAAAMRIGSARTVRSMTFGDNLFGNATNNFIRVDTVNDGNGGTPALTLQADSGNATVTQASGFQQDFLQLGVNAGGNVILGSSLDLFVNSATKPVKFDSIVSGGGGLNKYGVGTAELYRANTFSGGVNIFAGRIDAYNNSAALGTGATALGEASGAAAATLRVGNSVTLANAITVNTGSGTRTISNDAARAGNATLSGTMTLNKDATFDITFVTQGSHDRLTLSNAVGGTGGIVKTGTGTLIFSGTGNTYSGTTDIQGGKLFLGSAGRLGTGDVTIASGANLDFGTGAAQTNIVANNISGAGQLIQSTASTDTRLTGNVTSTGGLTINNGTLRIGNNTATGSYNGNTVVNSGAALAFDRTTDYTHSGTISGAGAVSKVSTGVVTLSGNNSYSGLTQIFTGAIVADHANALGSSDIRFNSAGGGTPILRYTASSAATDWATRFDGSDAAIRLDTNGNNVNLAGAIDSTNTAGLIKLGAGTLTLGGTNTYTGNTAANAGTLLINGSTAAGSTVSVGVNGTLGGSGTINGVVTVAGTLAPGNSPGTLNFADDLTLQSTATLSLEITGIGVGQFDILNGDGFNTLTLAGTLALNNTGYSATLGDSVTVFTNWSTITGSFVSITGTDLGGGLSWDTSNLYSAGSLVVIPEPSTWALLALFLTALVVFRRRRRTC